MTDGMNIPRPDGEGYMKAQRHPAGEGKMEWNRHLLLNLADQLRRHNGNKELAGRTIGVPLPAVERVIEQWHARAKDKNIDPVTLFINSFSSPPQKKKEPPIAPAPDKGRKARRENKRKRT